LNVLALVVFVMRSMVDEKLQVPSFVPTMLVTSTAHGLRV
jgi:hypothetical protein